MGHEKQAAPVSSLHTSDEEERDYSEADPPTAEVAEAPPPRKKIASKAPRKQASPSRSRSRSEERDRSRRRSKKTYRSRSRSRNRYSRSRSRSSSRSRSDLLKEIRRLERQWDNLKKEFEGDRVVKGGPGQEASGGSRQPRYGFTAPPCKQTEGGGTSSFCSSGGRVPSVPSVLQLAATTELQQRTTQTAGGRTSTPPTRPLRYLWGARTHQQGLPQQNLGARNSGKERTICWHRDSF